MTEEDRRSLGDFLGENKQDPQRTKSLDEILNADKADHAAARAETDAKRSMSRNRLIGAGVAVAVIVGGAFAFTPLAGVGPFGDDERPKLQAAEISDEAESDVELPFYEEEEIDPIQTPDWAKSVAINDASVLDEAREADARAALASSRLLGLSDSGLKLEDAGYTSDASKAVEKDGSLNLNFSFVTSDVFLRESNDITTRLLNPNYGGWGEFQYSGSGAKANFDVNSLKAITSDRYQKANFSKKDKSFLPVFADWNNNDYGLGDQLVPRGVRWIGEIKSADASFKYDKSNISYEVNSTYNVRFTALTKDQKKITKDGVMKIKYITDRAAAGDPSQFRIKIDEASLNVS